MEKYFQKTEFPFEENDLHMEWQNWSNLNSVSSIDHNASTVYSNSTD